MDLKRIQDFCWDCIMKVIVILTVAGVLSSPIWIQDTVSTIRQIGTNKGSIEANALQIASLITTMGEHGEEQEKQFEKFEKRLKKLDLLFGLATISDAGNELTAAININGNTVRFTQGTELKVTNRSDPSEVSIRVKVRGTFKAAPAYLLIMSAEPGRAIAASLKAIHVAIEPTEEQD